MRLALVRFAAACLVPALAACGGGGGGGSGAGTSSGGTTTSGLLPAAPPLGATLYADARVLRPMQDGDTWSYRGTATAYTGATPVAYLTTTAQSGTSATGATETMSNSDNTGPGSDPLSEVNGVVGSTQSVDFTGKGNPQLVNFIELRSPVQQGDQYTILDQHFTDTAIDADGDGKADALDLAIYARVAGMETVNLPNLPAMQAVRVDSFVLSRVTYSSNGQFSPIVQASTQAWYVDGVGIVRQTASVPSKTSGGVATTDEQVTAWDGITAGLGAMQPVAAVIPATSGVFPGQRLPTAVMPPYAFPFQDHALVLTPTPGFASLDTIASVVDLRGNVTTSTLVPGLTLSGDKTVVAVSGGVVSLNPGGTITNAAYDLTRIDAEGALIGAVRGATVDLSGGHVSSSVSRLAAAGDGTTLWLFWGRSYYDPGNGAVPGYETVLRPFSLDGAALAPEMLVETSDSGDLQITATNGQALLSWSGIDSIHHAKFGSASLAGLGPVQTLASGLPSAIIPLQLGTFSALVWPFPPGTNLSTGASGGVLLDSNLTPVRAGTTWLDEQIAGLPVYSVVPPASLGSRIVVTATQFAALWPGDSYPQNVDSVNWLDVAGTPLATTPVNSVRFASGDALRQAVFADRVLVFGGVNTLTTTVVWLNKGASQ
jgi:hypothetical protein